MIAYLLKNWKLLLDIVIIVAAIILLTLFDPFGMFSKRNLKGTANLVSSVKDIGELVTAEYYGEVISSLNQTIIFDIPEDDASDQFEECFYDLKTIAVEACKTRMDHRQFLKSKSLKKLKKNHQDNQIYQHLIVILGVNLVKPSETAFFNRREDKLRKNAERRVFKRMFNHLEEINKKHKRKNTKERNADFMAYINELPDFMNEATNFHYSLNEEARKKNGIKHDIVFIGRGSVKAGYKFEKLDERNLAYDKTNQVVHVFGLSPEILDKDINPWFVPERKIEGFQLVDYYRKAGFEEAAKVKKRCKEDLLKQAQKAGIIEQAQKNGKLALESFFSLLLNDPGVSVQFHPIPYEKEYNFIAADSLVTIQEALLIDSIFSQFKENIKKENSNAKQKLFAQQLNVLYKQFTKLNFIDSTYKFNIYSTEAAKILKNKYFVGKNEYNWFESIRGKLKTETIDKYEMIIKSDFITRSKIDLTHEDYMQQFNRTLECLDKEISMVSDSGFIKEVLKSEYNLVKNNIDFTTHFKSDTLHKTVDDEKVYELTRVKDIDFHFADLSYPTYHIDYRKFEKQGVFDDEKLRKSINSIISKQITSSQNAKYDLIRKEEMESVIAQYEFNKIKRDKALKPLKKTIEAINNPFKKLNNPFN